MGLIFLTCCFANSSVLICTDYMYPFMVYCSCTNNDGRTGFLQGGNWQPGVYRLHFDTDAYFKAQNTEGFYPYVEVSGKLPHSGFLLKLGTHLSLYQVIGLHFILYLIRYTCKQCRLLFILHVYHHIQMSVCLYVCVNFNFRCLQDTVVVFSTCNPIIQHFLIRTLTVLWPWSCDVKWPYWVHDISQSHLGCF